MNPALKKEVNDLRSVIIDNAGTNENDRFEICQVPDAPRMAITDTLTGKTIEVSLCHYAGALQVLNAFC